MHVEFLVEDESSEAAIEVLLERLLNEVSVGSKHSYRIHPFRSKQRMLTGLPRVLSGILRADIEQAVVVLIDADREDCVELKQRLQEMIDAAVPRNCLQGRETRIWIRIAVTELEAWFLGDPQATRAAYSRVTAGDLRLGKLQEPDNVPDAWEWLERLLIRRGHYVTRMPKIAVARNIARHLDLESDHNRSPSFRLFLRTMREAHQLIGNA